MNKIIKLSLFSMFLFVAACSKTESPTTLNPITSNPTPLNPTVDDGINHFIWKGLNYYYYWQKDVPDLADSRFNTLDELFLYFRKNSTPEATFESLLNKPADRFSWIVDDYVALENSFQGISLSNGMEFGLVRFKTNTSNIFGYVRYVVPGSSAVTEGVKRGMFFNTIDNTQLTDTNYGSLLFNDATSYTVGFADYTSGDPISNGVNRSLTKTELSENPIAISKVITEGSKKIGYLMYNQFSSSYDTQLNAVFANFKAQAVNELIIDLRYNGGGSVITATYLGGMITGQFNGSVFSKQAWNAKVHAAWKASDFINNFTNQIQTDTGSEAINNLNLTKVYFIVSGSSASASELIINSLSAYIDVKVVGVKTVGKQVGSITLYDSDDLQRTGANLNPNHKYAMQPLVLEIKNSKDQNYPEGITPGITLQGVLLGEDYANLGVLGETSDPLLARTIQLITTGAKTTNIPRNDIFVADEIYNSKLATPSKNNMYFDFIK